MLNDSSRRFYNTITALSTRRRPYSRGLLRYCEIFANIRITFVSSSTAGTTLPLPGAEAEEEQRDGEITMSYGEGDSGGDNSTDLTHSSSEVTTNENLLARFPVHIHIFSFLCFLLQN